jgi:hypothetical protein
MPMSRLLLNGPNRSVNPAAQVLPFSANELQERCDEPYFAQRKLFGFVALLETLHESSACDDEPASQITDGAELSAT